MWRVIPFFVLLLTGCVSSWDIPSDWTYRVVSANGYNIATYSDISDTASPIHIYIEGDGNSFDAYGRPTSNPTPTGTLVRDLAARDISPNVVYMARPCQFVNSLLCSEKDWTDGRFSAQIVDAMALVITNIAQNRPVVLIGYSGGAMISGLIIHRHPELNVQKWITVAGVLNHSDWTSYFGDVPLIHSLDMNTLPHVRQSHYIALGDRVVPNELSRRWVGAHDLHVLTDATHSHFPRIDLNF